MTDRQSIMVSLGEHGHQAAPAGRGGSYVGQQSSSQMRLQETTHAPVT